MLDLWGGIECTRNRVRDEYCDQLDWSGHAERLSDIDRIAALGIRTLRYPLLWDRLSPNGEDPRHIDWRWTDARMRRMQEVGIEPIIGLLHHGSGPRNTSLVSDNFVPGFVAFATAVAERYPWIIRWTPINEPLTTARFSALYGHWYPHARDDATFCRALVRQCAGIAAAMQAIRRVIPHAQLVQTEDVGKTYATPVLQYQADFENERRWLTFDLLSGTLTPERRMWSFIERSGVQPRELASFAENPCPPTIIGINHYVTSERYLDERVEQYAAATRGGNSKHAYADVEAARTRSEGIGGPRMALAETWARYRAPIAITEAHLAGTREQQLRWLQEVWNAATVECTLGCDVRAVTVWSLFGAHDWHNLVTAPEGRYEPGAFDVRSRVPRATALAAMSSSLARGKRYEHPVLQSPGWWRCDERFVGRAARRPANAAARKANAAILITGATGTLGQGFARICKERHLNYYLTNRAEMDIADPTSVTAMLALVRPWALVNAAGFVRVDDAERDRESCDRENCIGPAVLAAACQRLGIAFVTFSTDLVFDGARSTAYLESDQVRPLGNYGMSKAAAERVVLQRMPGALVIRSSAFFGPWDRHNFVTSVLAALAEERSVAVANDQVISPTYVPDLVHATLDLLIDAEQGLWHLANCGALSWQELAVRAAEAAGYDSRLVEGRPTAALGFTAPRPAFSALSSEHAVLLPNVNDALDRYARTRTAHVRTPLAAMTSPAITVNGVNHRRARPLRF